MSTTRRLPLPVALRIGAVLFAVAAAWGPRMAAPDGAMRVVLLDVSASVDASDMDLLSLADGLGGDDRMSLIVFGERARVVGALDDVSTAAWRDADFPSVLRSVPAGQHASDLQRALDSAAVHGGREGRLEVLVVTDGHVTCDPERRAAAALRLRDAGCVSLAFVMATRRGLGPRVASLSGPGRVRVGQPHHLTAEGDAGPSGGRLQLLRDGRVVDARDLPPGPFRTRFASRVDAAGETSRSARFVGAPPRPDPRAVVIAVQPGRALVLALEPLAPGLLDALGGDALVVAPDDPRVPQLLEAHDVVVLDGGTPTSAHVSEARPIRDGLAEWCASGGGLVLVGDVQWDGVSPLRTAPPDDPGTHVYVALDGSGSMAEEWPGNDGRTRDAVVRTAARELFLASSADTTVTLRRFNDRLLPVGEPAWTGRPNVRTLEGGDPARSGAERFVAALADLPPPGGGTALLPVLREAARVSSARAERTRRALIFTDGRCGDDPDALAKAVRSVLASDTRLTIVVDSSDGRELVDRAVSGTAARVVLVRDEFALLTALREAARPAPPGGDTIPDVRLRRGPGAGGVAGLVVPASARRVFRRWPAEGAGILVETSEASPVAALRSHGAGIVAALATRPGDPEWLGDDETVRDLLVTLRGAVERRGADGYDVERTADRILVRAPAGSAPRSVRFESPGGRVERDLLPSDAGLFAADVPESVREGVLRIVGPGGAPGPAFGLDRAAAPEYRGPPALDQGSVRMLAEGGTPRGGVSLRAWLACAAVVTLVAAQASRALRLSSRRADLPM